MSRIGYTHGVKPGHDLKGLVTSAGAFKKKLMEQGYWDIDSMITIISLHVRFLKTVEDFQYPRSIIVTLDEHLPGSMFEKKANLTQQIYDGITATYDLPTGITPSSLVSISYIGKDRFLVYI